MEENPIETIVEETVKRSFDISPENVYGFIVGLLVLAVIYLAWRLAQKERKLVELNVDSISVLKDLNTSLLLLRDDLNDIKNRLSK